MRDMTGWPAASSTTTLTVKAPLLPRQSGFREFLSELNPLQYIPVIGTIYRAVTGDTIPETAREAGSLVVSGLTGGPVGVAINLGTLAAEKITGIDPEKLGGRVLAGIGIGSVSATGTPVPAARIAPAPPTQQHAAIQPKAWSSTQLTAYGVHINASGDLQRGAVSGSDVLNELELARHGQEKFA
jgi:hypothetical protein